MDNVNDPALDVLINGLEQLRERYERDSLALEKAIARHKNAMLERDPEAGVEQGVKAGQYAGMGVKSALQAYLAERGGGPVKLKKCAIDLSLAGVNLGGPKRHERTIKITAANNKTILLYDKDTDTISLVSHAPPKKRSASSPS